MRGLTSEEVKQEIAAGHVNDSEVKTGRTYTQILIKNAITPFNCILFLLGALLLLCNDIVSAVSATGIIIINIFVSTIQEMKAKRRLDKIALMTRPKATVLRDGEEKVIQHNELVLNDVVILRAGDQALVDGELLECRSLEMDESLLTGESSSVRKEPRDQILSGSVCIAGEGYYKVTAFGTDTYASKLLSSAKKMKAKKTPLEMETTSITNILMAIAGFLMVISVVVEILIRHNSWEHTLQLFVVCLDIVPIALFLLITLTYMIAAVRMADKGVLLQNANSVESLSHVDTVCMDKTGTITTNKLKFESSEKFAEDAEHLVSMFATATGSKNKTVITLLEKYGETPCELLEEVQFVSKRKFSAVRVKDESGEHSLYMGAWNVIGPHCAQSDRISRIITEESSKGLRTVVLCEGKGPLYENDEPVIPDLEPVMAISIRDEVRPDCRDTIEVFLENKMDLKVISGDDPATVDALFSLANIPGSRKLITGAELDALEGEEKEKAVLESNIFGRMRPDDKEQVVEILKKNGRYVAMIGDGVNDVRSLKAAQVGVALESGSNAARGVADMVLVKDAFSALPKALIEGRKTISGMRDILKLYLTRNFALAVMFITVYLVLGNIPLVPIQNTFYAFFSVSAIAFFMTLFAKPDNNKSLILPDVLRFAIPSAVYIALFGLAMYALTWVAISSGSLNPDFEWMASVAGFDDVEELLDHLSWSGSEVEEICARSSLVLFTTLAGMGQILLVCPRYKFLSLDGRVNKSLVPLFVIGLLSLTLFAGYYWFPGLMVWLVNLVIFPLEYYAVLAVMLIIWFFSERFILKRGFFSKISDFFERRYERKLHEEYTKNYDEDDYRTKKI